MIQNRKSVTVNGRTYAWPQAPLVVICCDGSEPAYMEMATAEGLMPNLDRMIAKGENRRGLSAMPSFTNPNNLSIVTGAPPAVHGICGNYLIDPETGARDDDERSQMAAGADHLRSVPEGGRQGRGGHRQGQAAPAARQGSRLRRHAPCASPPRRPTRRRCSDNGIDDVCDMVGMAVPDVYSAELSEFVFAAGVKLLASHAGPISCICRPPTMCSTNMRRARRAPIRFYAMMDGYLGRARCARRHRRDRRRSRHEGQASAPMASPM